MRPLNVKRYKQDPSHCSIAASASLANFSNRKINYQMAKEICRQDILKETGGGLWSGQIGLLLNALGFRKVTVISSDLTTFDYSWKKLSKTKLIGKLEKAKRKRSLGTTICANCKSFYQFLSASPKNNVNIDYRFADYIKDALDSNYPIIISFNWTMFFEYTKENEKGKKDPFLGDYSEHAVVARGYNKKGVHIVDSHHRFYKYSRSKYRQGYYVIPWHELMTVMGQGDVIIPEEYDEGWEFPYELVQEKVRA